MSALTFTLKGEPDQRLDLASLTPRHLAGRSERQIARIEIGMGRERLRVGDVFALRMGDAAELRFAGGSERFDNIGTGMTDGAILVDGPAGQRLGRLMAGGAIELRGDCGPYAASRLSGGRVEIGGDAGDFLGAPLPGEMAGMAGGEVVVRGDAGARAGDRLRRGTLVVEGGCGVDAGARMLAGTLIVLGPLGGPPGTLMRRGTIVLMGPTSMSPTFADSGAHRLVFMRLLAAELRRLSPKLARGLDGPVRRFTGDIANGGKGEVFWPA